MSVGRICVRQVELVSPDETVQTAAARLRDHMVGSLVVGQAGQPPLGILTDRDLALRVVAAGLDPVETPVSRVMSRSPHCVREDASIEAALAQMRAGPHRRLPVVDESGLLVGVVTLDDILDLLAGEFREISGLLKQESPTSLSTV